MLNFFCSVIQPLGLKITSYDTILVSFPLTDYRSHFKFTTKHKDATRVTGSHKNEGGITIHSKRDLAKVYFSAWFWGNIFLLSTKAQQRPPVHFNIKFGAQSFGAKIYRCKIHIRIHMHKNKISKLPKNEYSVT